jgi:hypothetical protein
MGFLFYWLPVVTEHVEIPGFTLARGGHFFLGPNTCLQKSLSRLYDPSHTTGFGRIPPCKGLVVIVVAVNVQSYTTAVAPREPLPR